MQETFSRIEVGGEKYYLLTNLFDGGEHGFDLTVCNGERAWRQTGKVWETEMSENNC